MNGNSMLSSPNKILWEYFDSLRKLNIEAKNALTPNLCRQHSALAVIMAVTAAEVFLNLWFRVRVEELHSTEKRDIFLKELSERRSLDYKLKKWPMRYLNKTLNTSSGSGKELDDLKKLRNSIVHFTSSHETVEYGDVAIHGLANTTDYDNLTCKEAEWALLTAENFVAEIFKLAGNSNQNILQMLHLWIGRLPT